MSGIGCDLCKAFHDTTATVQSCGCGCHGMRFPASEPYAISPTKVEVDWGNKRVEEKLDEIILLLKELLKK